jgi:hypothetical protein
MVKLMATYFVRVELKGSPNVKNYETLDAPIKKNRFAQTIRGTG